MAAQTYSFSTSKEHEKKLVEELKKRCDETGVSFSFVINKLIKQHLEQLGGN